MQIKIYRMKISYNWVKNHIHINLPAVEIAKKLTLSGLEVESVEEYVNIKGGLEGLVIGEVIECAKHPNADKLSVTKVDIGLGELQQIVCGAPNVAAGQKVIVATIGAVLFPSEGDSFTIKKSKIRGEESFGMICAEDEIGLGSSHAGIMVLDTDLANGTPASHYIPVIKDDVIEIGLTPNRADAFSHFGVAREIKALTGLTLNSIDTIVDFPNNTGGIEVTVLDNKACPRYCGVELKNLTVKESPDWLKNALLAIDINPINNIVDVTNYILHDLGQPLHAFDLAKISGSKLNVRFANENEPFVTLDGVERKLKTTDLVIADVEKPMCLAGVFGGKESGVSESTTAIFLESAYFNPDVVRKASIQHGLKTDSSFRFERGTDPNMPVKALKKAVQILLEVAGGEISSTLKEVYPTKIEDFSFSISTDRVRSLIGISISDAEIEKILLSLEIQIIAKQGSKWDLIVPSYRVDVQREADITEEVLRIIGFDSVSVSPYMSTDFVANDNADKDRKRSVLSNLLTDKGYSEIITNSLTSPKYYQNSTLFNPENSVEILNKLSEDLGVMRQSPLYNGLEVLVHNINRRQVNLKMYEFGKCYAKSSTGFVEREVLSVYLTGDQFSETWIEKSTKVTFHAIAEIIQLSFLKLGIVDFKQETFRNEIFEEAISFVVNGTSIASFGKLKKAVLKQVGLKTDVFYAELEFEKALELKKKSVSFQEISKYPEVRRDLSMILDKTVSFDTVKEVSLKVNRKLIKDINVFDVYEGEQIGVDKKSYSVSYILQDANDTLTDKTIDGLMNKLMSTYENELGAVIRK